MRLMSVVLPTLLGLAIGLAATPASARYLDIEDVRAMAFDKGIVRLEEIELNRRRGIWKVEGDDAYGHEIEMKVDAVTGRIIKLERD
ncbi:PepSY domain-containing protein [Methyloceanibacter superfactus]|nr:PepSY domain-containing protein [Methyloceanibacter superfactus]